jgi:TatD DNase family protein
MIFDTHAHYDDEQFDIDREELIDSLKEYGIGNVVDIGASISSSKAAVELSHRYDFFYAAVGVHPSEVEELNDENISEIIELSRDDKCVAIGEIGLDYHWPDPAPKLQQIWFRKQLDIARREKLPVIIHSRDAAQDTLSIMEEENAQEIGGVVHCFSYSKEIAKKCVDMGFYIGIGGVLTFKNARKMVEVVEQTPLERILLETDCPYLAPEPFRGKRNSSQYLPYVVTKMAQIKGVSEEEVIRITEENARKMYRLEDLWHI